MRKVIYDIDINLQEYDIKACMQNDDINLIINIYENEKNYDLMGAKATLNWSKPDGTPLKKDMDINKNIVSITLNKDYTDIKGKAKLDIEIVKEGTVSTFPLCLVIVEKVFQSNKVNNKIVELLDIIKMDEYIDEFLDGIKKKQTELSSQIDEKANNVKYVYSKIKADGVTDDTQTLIEELNSLEKFECLVTPNGISVINQTLNMTSFKDNVILDFSATTFRKNTISNTIILKLTNSDVIGLTIDGGRDNKSFNDENFGTDFLFKIDANCKNVTFNNTTLLNAPFCGVMLGQNLKNIKFNNLRCVNIGEHIFYKTGFTEVGKNIENFICEDVYLNNVGVNKGNLDIGHFVHVFKDGNDGDSDNVGYCDNISFRNITLIQDDTYVGVTIFGGHDIRNSTIDNIKGDFEAIHSTHIAINLKCINSTVLRGFYTNAGTKHYENVTFENCIFKGYSPHFNLASHYKNCTFDYYCRSSNTDAIKNNTLIFDNCLFKVNTNISFDYIYNNIYFINCTFLSFANSYNSSYMFGFGQSYCADDVCIKIINCVNDATNFAFLFSFRNEKLNVELMNMIVTGRMKTSATINNIDMQNILYKFSDNYYSPVSTDIVSNKISMINVRTDNNVFLDNYNVNLGGISGKFTDNTGKVVTIKNGLIVGIN